MRDAILTSDFSPGRPRVTAPLEIKLGVATAKTGELEGYASRFDSGPDRYGHVVEPGAFAATIAEHKAAGRMPAMLWSHEMTLPIGRWLELREDSRGLLAKGQLNLRTDHGRDAFEHLEAGDVDGLSIGWLPAKGGASFDSDGTVRLKAIQLFEISVVPCPAKRARHGDQEHDRKPARVRGHSAR
jgi:HK97 family phage prohead protease